MSRRGTGVLFCFIAAILFCTQYLTAALYSISSTGTPINGQFGQESFRLWLDYVGNLPTTLSVVALFIGLVYLVLAEFKGK